MNFTQNTYTTHHMLATSPIRDIWNKTYLGNTVQEWLIALSIIFGSYILGKIVYWIFLGFTRKLTARSKTEVDDIIIDLIEQPVVASIFASGIWFGLNMLTLPEVLDKVISRSYSVLIWLLIGWLLVRFFNAFYRSVMVPWAERTDNDLDDQIMPILGRAIRSIIWIMAIVIGLDSAGYNIGALIAGLGIGGLALAMAAKDTVSNIFGGFTIFTDKPFKLGDRIVIDGIDGTVSEIGLRSTRITTLAGRIVTMPNSSFADSPVENISAEPNRKVVLNLGLVYDTSDKKIEEAIETLKTIVGEHPSTEENVLTAFNGFGDFALNIMLIYYIKKSGDILATQTEINLQILRQFNERQLDFAFPTQTLINVEG